MSLIQKVLEIKESQKKEEEEEKRVIKEQQNLLWKKQKNLIASEVKRLETIILECVKKKQNYYREDKKLSEDNREILVILEDALKELKTKEPWIQYAFTYYYARNDDYDKNEKPFWKYKLDLTWTI